MGKLSKALAGGMGAAGAKVVVGLIQHFLPTLDMGTMLAVEFIVYTLLTGGIVYAAPANTP